MKRLALCLITVSFALAVAACGRVATPTATPLAATDTPTLEATVEPTATPTLPPPTDTPAPPTATPMPPTPTPEPAAVVNADPSLFLREGPGTNFKSLANIPLNTKVTLLARNTAGDWVKVKSAEFGEGWVKAEFLDFPAGVQAQALPLATESAAAATAPTVAPPPTRPPAAPATATAPAASTSASPTALPAATPGAGGDIDQYIGALLAGTHNRLGSLAPMGPAPAGGKVELVIANDSPFGLKVSLGSPAGTETRLDACQDCKVYETQSPGTCAPEKPQKTLRIDPGALRLAIETSSSDIAPYVGEWTLQADQKYMLCFYILRNPPAGQ